MHQKSLVAKIIRKSLNLFGLVNFWLTFPKEKQIFFVISSPDTQLIPCIFTLIKWEAVVSGLSIAYIHDTKGYR